jgi:hypothetical protein
MLRTVSYLTSYKSDTSLGGCPSFSLSIIRFLISFGITFLGPLFLCFNGGVSVEEVEEEFEEEVDSSI